MMMVLFFKTRAILTLKLLAIPLTILYQLTKFEAPSYRNEVSTKKKYSSKYWVLTGLKTWVITEYTFLNVLK